MKKGIFTLMFTIAAIACSAQQWIGIKSNVPNTIQTTLVSSSEDKIAVNVQVPGFYAIEINTPHGAANVIAVPKTVSTAAAGEPDLPMMAIPALIGDRQHYDIRVIEAQYADFQMEVAPSKGDFSRQIDPADVPYTYGEAYSTDAFFPAQNVGLYDPYIMRDFRGQNMIVYPFAFNPVTHTLRVYYDITVELFNDGQQGKNTLEHRSKTLKMDPEIRAMYERQFINFGESLSKYTPIDETGELLIICHDAFMNAMQPFVNWKKQIGRPTTLVGTSTTGTSYSAIKAYIQNHYNSNPNLTHVLLVGDVAQIPGYPYSAGSYSGKSDNIYGQVAGNDLYNEIIIGRFSAENETHVTTQVNKVIHYERDLNASDTWLTTGCGVSTTAGNGGHFGEDDYQHINNIRDDLMAYHYATVYQEYYNVSGYSSTTQQISDRVNSGVSIINYCNHGSRTAWQSHNPYYSNTYVNALTNDNMLPIIWSVACYNGQYDYSQPCFGETWLRATNNSTGVPTGAVGGMFSYISQPWIPPMYGQDEMVDVLVESYNGNIKRTLGGCSLDGNMKIIDQYGPSSNPAKGTYLAWILYGDPTLTLRNAVPADMGVTHESSISTDATSFIVNATNGEGALATLTLDNEILGSATISNGTCIINFAAPDTIGTATLTVFGYNKITYVATIDIAEATSDITQTAIFEQGWNWLSSYVEADNLMEQLTDGLGANGQQIKSQTQFTTNYGDMWLGALDSLDNESCYLIRTNADCEVELTGTEAYPADHPITLNPGWSWIGYPSTEAMMVSNAFVNYAPSTGDVLKSQQGYATYYPELGWIGSLKTLTPGMGLYYRSSADETTTLVYPVDTRITELAENITAENNHWVPNVHAYPNNMTVTAVVELNGEELHGENYEVAAFANGECRGSARLMYIEPVNRHMAFLTIAGDEASELHFSLYNAQTGNVETCHGASLQYETNAVVGDVETPYVISFRGTTEGDVFGTQINVFPNPVPRGEVLNIGLPNVETLRATSVEIINVFGQVVETVCAPSVQAIPAPKVVGVYFLRLTNDTQVYIEKIVVE